MSTFITGNKGYIGSRLAERLNSREKIGIIDRKAGADINDFGPFHWPNADTVYHLAAQAGAMPSWENPYRDAMDNIMATIRIAEMFPDAKIIFTTSGAAIDPESPYGLSKKTAEEYLKMLHDNVVILRLSSVYGGKDRGVVDTFIREDKCTIYGDGSAIRDFVNVSDVVSGLVKAKDWPAGEYSMGSGVGVMVQDIADATGKPVEYKEARKGEKQEVTLINTTPDWEPKINVLEYVEESCK